MQLRLDEKQTIQYLTMQAIEEDCIINANEKIEYPPVALSLGEKLIKSLKTEMTDILSIIFYNYLLIFK